MKFEFGFKFDFSKKSNYLQSLVWLRLRLSTQSFFLRNAFLRCSTPGVYFIL